MARRREDLSGWNPMEDDYMDDDFNSYNEGPGKNLPKRSQRTSSCVKLYVTGIPEGTTNEGLRDLFGRAGMVLNASVCVNKFPGNRRTTFGFVEMENTAGGTEALRLLNGFRIGDEFVLRVQIAKSDEEKQREKEEKQRELEFLDSLPGVGKKRSSIRNTSDSGSDTGDNFVVSRTGEKIMFGKQRNLANGSELHNFQMSPRSMTSDKSGLCTGSKISAANVDPSIFHTPVSNKSPAKLSERFENLQITTPNEGARKIAVMKEELQEDFTGLAAQNGYGDNYNRFNRNSYFRGRGMGPFGDMHPMNRNMGGYGRGRGAFNIHSQQHFPPGGYGGPMGRGFHRQGGYSGGYNGGYGGGGYNGGYGGGGYNGGYIADFNSGYGRGYNGSYQDNFRRGYHGQGNQYSNYQNGNQFQDNRPRPKSINYRPEYPRKKNYGRRPCNVCQNEGPFNCSICGTPYCSQSCQKDDWPRHKAFCQKLKVEREEEEAIESQFEFSVGDDILEKMVKTVEQFTGDKVEVKKKNTSQQKSPKQGSPKKKKSLSPKSKQGNNKSPGSKPNHNVQNDPSKSGTSSQKSPRVAYQNTSGTTCKQVASGSTPASSKLTIKMDALPINVETDVIVLSVSGPDSIMLQLFNEKNVQVAVELEEKMTQMYSKDGNMVEVSPVVGDFLAGQYMGSWYRLCVDEVISNDTFKVTYIDYGNKEEVALLQMRYLSEEMLTLPGQAIECCLEGVVLPGHASSPQVIEKVKELIPPTVTSGSLYKATAIKHQNNLTYIKILDSNGVDVGKQLAEKGLASTSTTEKGSDVIGVSSIGNVIDSLNIGTCLQLFVIERLSPTRCICQIVEQDFLKKFSEFQQQFTKLYQHNTFPEYRPKCVGELVVGNFSMDKEWYRAEVLEMTESQANLCYIDFGNKETVPFSCIRYARDICTKLPSQSFVCVVADVDSETLPESSLSMLNDALSQQKLTVKVKKTEGKELHVDLLNSEGQAILEASKPQEKKIIFTDVAKVQIPTDGQKLDMMFSDATSLYSFYMRRSDSESQAVLGNVMREVHEYCSKTDIPYSPVIDEMVCGKFSADGVWYRARVLDIIEDVYAVQYVDYGTLDNVRSDAIRKIDPCLLTTPIQAVHCRLARVMPELETSDMLKMFATAMRVPSMKVQATHIGNEITDILIYTDDGASLNERMLVPDEEISEKEVKADVKSNLETLERLEGKALDKSDLEKLQVPLDGTKVKVMVTDFFGLCSFVVQSLENLQAFAELMNEMGIHCESISSPYSAAVGETICAKFSDDNIWYRAKVLECIAGENYKVVFLDYGNFDILTPASFRRLDPRFVGMPSQSFPCKLLGVEEEGQPEDALATFAGKVSNTALELEAVNVVDSVYEVKLYDSDGCEINSLFSKGSSPMLEASNGGGVVTEISPPKILTKLSEMTKQSPPEGQCSVLITHANSPQDFYCQLAEYEAIQSLAVLMQSLMLSCEMEKQTANFAPSIGDLCCAIYAADGGWYRGVVTGVNDGNYSILYLDFGNEGIVPADKIRSPTLEFSSLPIMAFKCSLTGISPMGGSWSSASVDKMNDYQARELSATIMSKSDNVHQVQISCDGVDIASQLISCGLAQKIAASNTQGKEVDEKEALQRQIMELQAKLKLIG